MLIFLHLRGLSTVDAKNGYYFVNFFDRFINIIDIDIKVVRLNKYTLEIHLKKNYLL